MIFIVEKDSFILFRTIIRDFIKLSGVKKRLYSVNGKILFEECDFYFMRSQSWMVSSIWGHFNTYFAMCFMICMIPFRINLVKRCCLQPHFSPFFKSKFFNIEIFLHFINKISQSCIVELIFMEIGT